MDSSIFASRRRAAAPVAGIRLVLARTMDRGFARFRHWLEVQRGTEQLRLLNDRMLADVGLERHEVGRAVREASGRRAR